MSLKVFFNIRYQGLNFQSGHCYHFGYSRYENDPHPIIFMINAILGTHPHTGHFWNLIQGINLNYIPKNSRLRFVEMWKPVVTMGANMYITWKKIQAQFPFLRGKGGFIPIRRYLLGPGNYILKPRWVPAESYNRIVIKGMTKDYFQIQWKKIEDLANVEEPVITRPKPKTPAELQQEIVTKKQTIETPQ